MQLNKIGKVIKPSTKQTQSNVCESHSVVRDTHYYKITKCQSRFPFPWLLTVTNEIRTCP